jgi:hypothetical protein
MEAIKYGDARVSTDDQDPALQLAAEEGPLDALPGACALNPPGTSWGVSLI